MLTSIRQRLIMVMAVVALGPSAYLWLYSYDYFKSHWLRSSTASLSYLHENTAAFVDEALLEVSRVSFAWQQRPDWANWRANSGQVEALLESLVQETEFISDVLLVDGEGIVRAANQHTMTGASANLRDSVGRRFPASADLDPVRPVISPWRQTHLGEAVVDAPWLALPLAPAPGGDAQAWLVSFLNRARLESLLQRQAGRLAERDVAHGAIAMVEAEERRPLIVARTAQLAALPSIPATRSTGGSDAASVSRSGARVSIEGHDWTLWRSYSDFGPTRIETVTLIDQDDLLTTVNDLLRSQVVLFSGVAVLIIIAILLLARTLSNPIRNLTRQAESLGAGDYESEITVGTSGRFADAETRRLAAVLDDARGNVASYVERIQASERTLEAKVRQRTAELESSHEALRVARDDAFAANRAKSDFLANMSHELRTPMNAVVAMTDLVLKDDLKPAQRDMLQTVRTSADALLTVINDILDFSKIEAGKLEFEVADFDLPATVDEVGALLAQNAFDKRVELVCEVDSDVPARVRGDRGRLRQVLLNLGNNAVKFTESGEVVIRASLDEDDTSKRTVRFTVRDTGIGISEEARSRLFAAFSQSDASITRRFGGTGLGLVIAKRLTEMMNGQIGVRSELGAGSTFWFTARFDASRPARPVTDACARAGSPAFAGRRVLVVERNETARESLARRLGEAGYDVAQCASGAECIEWLRSASRSGKSFDAVLLDGAFPDSDGASTAREIARTDGVPKPFRVLMTASASRQAARQLEAEGDVEAVLAKPVSRARLLGALRNDDAAATHAPERDPTQLLLEDLVKPPADLHCLLAEDNLVNQKVATLLLAQLGINRLDLAANGLEAVDAVKRGRYDFVLMDCQMPDMDGLQASREIRAFEADGKYVPIIAMTANAMRGDRERCLDAGMNDYVSKPVALPMLAAALRRVLAPSGQASASAAMAKPRLGEPTEAS